MRSLLRLIPYFRKHRARYGWGLLFVVISCIGAAYIPRLIGTSISSLEKGTSNATSLMINALEVVALSAVSGYLFYLVRQFIIVASRELEYDLRNDFLAHIQTLSMKFYHNTPQGEVMAYATNDINAVRNFLGPAIMYTADTLCTFIFALVFMVMISPIITIAVLTPLPLMSLGVYLIGKRVSPLADSVQSHYADLTARSTESISGMKVIKAYVRDNYEQKIFDNLSHGYYKKNMRLIKIQGLMMPVIFGFVGLSIAILLWLGAPKVIDGSFTLGDITQFVMYLGMLTWPFIALGWVTNMVQRSAASMARLNIIFDMKPDITDTPDCDRSITSIRGAIEFRNISFSYRDNSPIVLQNISFSVDAGKSIAIIGKTGSGKTSLLELIPRLYDAKTGSIYIDGINIHSIPLDVLRKNIGFVTQEAFLFSDTIKANIAFGLDQYDDVKVRWAARMAEIEQDILDFPSGYDTIVGERGITLSGGQRTSLARAIARDPRILILDDSLSAVDTHTEERILNNLREVMKGRTTIIVSHRISTIKDADMIYVLDNGGITESGSHTQLLERGGWYYELYQKQLLEEELEEA